MASVNDVPRDFNEALRLINRRLISIERRRVGDGVNIDGNCEYGGGAGGDGGYYGGGGNFPNPDFPDSSYPPYLDDWLNDWITDHPEWGGGGFDPGDFDDLINDWFDDHPGWGGEGGGAYSAGANIAIESSTIHFEVVFSEPPSPRIGQLWFDNSA